MSIPLRLHYVSVLDDAGIPQMTSTFLRRLDRIRIAGQIDWWQHRIICGWLTDHDDALGLEIIQHLHGRPRATVAMVQKMLGMSRQRIRRHYEATWNLAYDRFHTEYPGLLYKRWHDEMWTAAL